MALSGNGRRLELAQRVERAFNAALTGELFGDGPEFDVTEAASRALKSGGTDSEALSVLKRAGWTTTSLTRVPAKTATADVPGTMASKSAAGQVPRWLQDRVDERQRPTRRMLDALSVDLPLGDRPFLLGPPAPPTAATEVAEFGEAGSRVFNPGSGAYVTPSHISRAGDISWQAAKVQDAILALVAEDALFGVGQWLVGKLVGTAGTAVATVAAAMAAIEGAGWFPDTILAPLSRIDRVSTALGALGAAALQNTNLLVAPVGARVLVVDSSGVDARVSRLAQARVAEPAIGGFEVSASYWATYQAAANSVKQVTA